MVLHGYYGCFREEYIHKDREGENYQITNISKETSLRWSLWWMDVLLSECLSGVRLYQVEGI